MPNDFDRIEDERDLTAGLEYEAVRARRDDGPDYEADAYDLSDPKHPDHHDTFADLVDLT